MTRLQAAPPPGGDRDSATTAYAAITATTRGERERTDARSALGHIPKDQLVHPAYHSKGDGRPTGRHLNQWRRRSHGRHLWILRRSLNHDGWGRCRSTGPGRRVVLYVRTSYGEDAEPVIEQLRHRAEARRWTVDRVIHDQVSMGAGPPSTPECWPGWRIVRDLINNRWVHGVLAPDRSDISTDDTLYVRELRRIAADGAFTALLTRESVPSRTLRCRLEARGIGWRQIAAQLLLVLAVGAAVPSLLLSTFTPRPDPRQRRRPRLHRARPRGRGQPVIHAAEIIGSGTNILFVTLDSLRYDIAAQAHEAGDTPHLNALLPPGGWQRRWTPGTFTLPAHMAFFSGFLPKLPQPKQPPRLWECRPPAFKTPDPTTFVFEAPSLLEGLTDHGYHTVCVGGVTYFSRQTPLGSVLPDMFREDHWRPEFCSPEPDSTRHQVDQALDIAGRYEGDRPLFLFVNVSATHVPHGHYTCDSTDSRASQAGALRYADEHLARLITHLTVTQRWLIIMCADHGDAYGDDGFTGRGIAHPSVVNVPFTSFARGGATSVALHEQPPGQRPPHS